MSRKLLRSPWIRLGLFCLLCLGVIFALQFSWDRSYRTATGVPRSFAPFGDEVRRSDGSVDYRATLNRLVGEPPAPEKNAAVVYAIYAAHGGLKDGKLRAALFSAIGVSEAEFAAGQAFYEGYMEAEKTSLDSSERLWKGERDYPEMAAWLDQFPEQISRFRAASRLQWYCPLVNPDPLRTMVFDLLPLSQSAGVGTRMLLSDAFREAGRGNHEQAVADVVAVYQTGLRVGGPLFVQESVAGFMRGRGIGAARELLEQLELTESQLEMLAAGFQADPAEEFLQPAKGRGERYLILDFLQGIERGDLQSADLVEFFKSEPSLFGFGFGFGPLLDRGATLQQLNLRFDTVQQWQDLTELQGEAITEAQRRILPASWMTVREMGGVLLSPVMRGKWFADRIMAAEFSRTYPVLAAARIRLSQLKGLLQLAIAIERFERRHGGYPDSLDQLVPEFLPKLPVDHFAQSGSFGYRKSERGFRLFAEPRKPKGLPGWSDVRFEIEINRSQRKPDEAAE